MKAIALLKVFGPNIRFDDIIIAQLNKWIFKYNIDGLFVTWFTSNTTKYARGIQNNAVVVSQMGTLKRVA